jgi:hypothetical protein
VPCEEDQIKKVAVGKLLLDGNCEAIKNLPNIDIVLVNELAEYWRSCEEAR